MIWVVEVCGKPWAVYDDGRELADWYRHVGGTPPLIQHVRIWSVGRNGFAAEVTKRASFGL